MTQRRITGEDLDRADIVWACLFFLIAFALRVPFRTQFAYHWDSAQFALAVETYDLRISQPQAPGYFLYVMLGRLINLVVGEPHASLVWLSVCAGAMLPAVGFLLAKAMFNRGTGIATALILATSPLCWFHSEVALTTIVDSMLVTATVLACWLTIRRGGQWIHIALQSGLFALVAGVRPQTGVILLPLWLYALFRSTRSRRPRVLMATILTVGLCVLWFFPMVQSAGGMHEYVRLLQLKSQFDAPKTAWGGGVAALMRNIDIISRLCWVGLLAAAVVGILESFFWIFRETRLARREVYTAYAEQIRLLALWVGPMSIFWVGTYVTTAGYVLCFFPGLALFAGIAVCRLATRVGTQMQNSELLTARTSLLAARGLIMTVVAAVNIFVFIFELGPAEPFVLGLPLTAGELRQHDRQISGCIQAVRASFRPDRVTIYHAKQFFYWGFRQFQYHLPEYRNVLLTGDSSLLVAPSATTWVSQGHKTLFLDHLTPSDHKHAVVVVPPGESVNLYSNQFAMGTLTVLAESGAILYLETKPEPVGVQKLDTAP